MVTQAALRASLRRMAIVLATFTCSSRCLLDLSYSALLFKKDQAELSSLVGKNAHYSPQGILQSSSWSKRGKQTMNASAIVVAFVSQNQFYEYTKFSGLQCLIDA